MKFFLLISFTAMFLVEAHATKNDDESALERVTEGAVALEDREFDNIEIEDDEPVIEDPGDAEELAHTTKNDDEAAQEGPSEGADAFGDREFDSIESEDDEPSDFEVIEDPEEVEELDERRIGKDPLFRCKTCTKVCKACKFVGHCRHGIAKKVCKFCSSCPHRLMRWRWRLRLRWRWFRRRRRRRRGG